MTTLTLEQLGRMCDAIPDDVKRAKELLREAVELISGNAHFRGDPRDYYNRLANTVIWGCRSSS